MCMNNKIAEFVGHFVNNKISNPVWDESFYSFVELVSQTTAYVCSLITSFQLHTSVRTLEK